MNVLFRKFSDGEVIALFPQEIADHQGHILSYQHRGQHGPASVELVHKLAPASAEEYQPLLNELINQVGYTDLVVQDDVSD